MASRGCQSFLNLFGNSFTLLCNRLHHYIHLCDSVCSYYQKWYHMKLIKENKVNIVYNWNKLNDFIIKWKNTFFVKYVFFGEIWSFKKSATKIHFSWLSKTFFLLSWNLCPTEVFCSTYLFYFSHVIFYKKPKMCVFITILTFFVAWAIFLYFAREKKENLGPRLSLTYLSKAFRRLYTILIRYFYLPILKLELFNLLLTKPPRSSTNSKTTAICFKSI